MLSELNNSYDFYGTHYLSSFNKCDNNALINIDKLRSCIKESIIKSGATIISYTEKIFDNNGYTIIYLLSESHCSIHTYPEHGSLFTDLFTCGTNCDYKIYEENLKNYLKSEDIQRNIIIRSDKNKVIE